MKGPLLLPPLLALLCSLHTSSGSEAAGWCYSSQKDVEHNCTEPCQWATLHKTCDGEKQSPIGISTKNAIIKDELKPFSFHGYDKQHNVVIQNNGHSVQATLNSSNTISGGGLFRNFQAVQFHLHWGDRKHGGSEHLIDSVRYPAELHIVHSIEGTPTDQYTIAVLAFLYKVAPDDNPAYAPLITALEKIPHKENKTTINSMQLKSLIPEVEKLNRYFRYKGSLTTPVCSESVIWTIFEEEIELSEKQIQAFSDKLFFPDGKTRMHNNYRPVQELLGREVQRGSTSTPLLQGATIFITSAFVYLMTGLQH